MTDCFTARNTSSKRENKILESKKFIMKNTETCYAPWKNACGKKLFVERA